MVSMDERQVDALAANVAAITNGREIARRKSLSGLSIGDDGKLLFGSCKGSGAKPYACSVDFADPVKPVPRCNCPSRQSPCKHCLGLLYAWVGSPKRFRQAAPPPELVAKRAKVAKRAARRVAAGSVRAKGGAAGSGAKALRRKLQTQLDALDLLEKLLGDVVGRGLAAHDDSAAAALAKHATMLRGAFLPGAELALSRLSDVISRARAARGRGEKGIDADYHHAMEQLARLEALIRRGRSYLEARVADVALAPETDTAIAAWLGHAWGYEELRDAGRGEGPADLVQLAFFVVDDRIGAEHVDTGIWLHLGDGRLFHTETRRPYKAGARVKAEDSDFELARVAEFVRHPGESPERIRWRGRQYRKLVKAHYTKMNAVADPDGTDIAALIKSVRDDMKSPLGAAYRIALVRPASIGSIGSIERTRYVIEDAAGARLELADDVDPARGIRPTTHLLPLVGRRAEGAAIVCLFHTNPLSRALAAQPLAFLHAGSLTRLLG